MNCDICSEFELNDCMCDNIKHNTFYNMDNEITIDSEEDIKSYKIGNIVNDCVNNKFYALNELYNKHNILNIKNNIKDETDVMCDKYIFKNISDYLKELISNNMIFHDIGVRYNMNNKWYKKENLLQKINDIFPPICEKSRYKCKYLVNKKYCDIIQNIIDECNIIHDSDWLKLYCYNCDYNNMMNESQYICCVCCNSNIDVNEYRDKYNKLLSFGINSVEYNEKYKKIMELKNIITKIKIFLVAQIKCLEVETPRITDDMGNIYNYIESLKFDNYFENNKLNHMDLYEKWKVYYCYYSRRNDIRYNIVDINSINIYDETNVNNRYISYDKYNEDFENWYSMRNYYYHIYIIEKGIDNSNCEINVIKIILSFSHPNLEPYSYDDMKSYNNDFYRWYLTIFV
jgi:hypothetical protein